MGAPGVPFLFFMWTITQGGALDHVLIATGLIFEARDEVRRYRVWLKTKPRYYVWKRMVLP